MRKIKTTCHVCGFIIESPNAGAVDFCELCITNLKDPNEELRITTTTISNEGGGIRAEEVHVILTNRRIIFTGDEECEGIAETLGWIFGGWVGGLIGGAVDEAKSKNTRQVSVKFEDIASLEVERSPKLRNAKIFTICDKQGNTYFFQLGKKEADRWETSIKNRLAAVKLQ